MSGDEGLWLGLDVGTQGTKGVLYDAGEGRVTARASSRYGLIEGLPPGAAEQDPRTWIEAVSSVCAALADAAGPDAWQGVRGVGVSGQQHGLVVLDGDGRVVRPAKLWCDTSTAAEAEELSQALGRRVPAGFTAPKVLWMQRHEPERWARVRTVLLPHDYVNLRLTGRPSMEAGDASGTGVFDPVARRFDEQAVRVAGMAGLLPGLVPAGDPAGAITPEGAALTGLAEGTLVATGGGDNMMSAIGAGATRPGVVVLSLGTSGTVFCRSEGPVVDPDGLIAAFCDSAGAWLPLLCVMNVTGVLHEVAAAFAPDEAGALDRLTAEAARVPPGAGGLQLVPYLAGERVPDLPEAAGALCGIRPGLLRPGVVFRAALEGTALNLAWGVARLRDLGIAVDAVRLVGGGAANPLWRRILADALDAPNTVLEEPESAALGGALQAWWTARRQAGEDIGADAVAASAVGVTGRPVEPERAGVRLYAEALDRFRDRVERLFR